MTTEKLDHWKQMYPGPRAEPGVGVGREEQNRLEAGWDQPLRASNTTLIR